MAVDLSSRSIRQLARALAAELGSVGAAPPAASPAAIDEYESSVETTDELTLAQAQRFAGLSRTGLWRFLRDHPGARVVDGNGRTRVRKHWLQALAAGKDRLRALDRAHAMEVRR